MIIKHIKKLFISKAFSKQCNNFVSVFLLLCIVLQSCGRSVYTDEAILAENSTGTSGNYTKREVQNQKISLALEKHNLKVKCLEDDAKLCNQHTEFINKKVSSKFPQINTGIQDNKSNQNTFSINTLTKGCEKGRLHIVNSINANKKLPLSNAAKLASSHTSSMIYGNMDTKNCKSRVGDLRSKSYEILVHLNPGLSMHKDRSSSSSIHTVISKLYGQDFDHVVEATVPKATFETSNGYKVVFMKDARNNMSAVVKDKFTGKEVVLPVIFKKTAKDFFKTLTTKNSKTSIHLVDDHNSTSLSQTARTVLCWQDGFKMKGGGRYNVSTLDNSDGEGGNEYDYGNMYVDGRNWYISFYKARSGYWRAEVTMRGDKEYIDVEADEPLSLSLNDLKKCSWSFYTTWFAWGKWADKIVISTSGHLIDYFKKSRYSQRKSRENEILEYARRQKEILEAQTRALNEQYAREKAERDRIERERQEQIRIRQEWEDRNKREQLKYEKMKRQREDDEKRLKEMQKSIAIRNEQFAASMEKYKNDRNMQQKEKAKFDSEIKILESSRDQLQKKMSILYEKEKKIFKNIEDRNKKLKVIDEEIGNLNALEEKCLATILNIEKALNTCNNQIKTLSRIAEKVTETKNRYDYLYNKTTAEARKNAQDGRGLNRDKSLLSNLYDYTIGLGVKCCKYIVDGGLRLVKNVINIPAKIVGTIFDFQTDNFTKGVEKFFDGLRLTSEGFFNGVNSATKAAVFAHVAPINELLPNNEICSFDKKEYDFIKKTIDDHTWQSKMCNSLVDEKEKIRDEIKEEK